MLNENKYTYRVDMMRLIKMASYRPEERFNIIVINGRTECFKPLFEQLESITARTICVDNDKGFDCIQYVDDKYENNELHIVFSDDADDTLVRALIDNEDEIVGGFIITSKEFLFTEHGKELLGFYAPIDINIVNSDIGFSFVNKDYLDCSGIAADVHIHNSDKEDGKVVGCKLFEHQLSFLEGDMRYLGMDSSVQIGTHSLTHN